MKFVVKRNCQSNVLNMIKDTMKMKVFTEWLERKGIEISEYSM